MVANTAFEQQTLHIRQLCQNTVIEHGFSAPDDVRRSAYSVISGGISQFKMNGVSLRHCPLLSVDAALIIQRI